MGKKYLLNLDQIGERLRHVRETLHMTLEAMQQVSGFSKSLISAAEKGQKKPSAIYLAALHEQFNVDVNYILSGNCHMFHQTQATTDKESPDDTYQEMLFTMERVKMVRYSMMSYFLLFKSQNKTIIEEMLSNIKYESSKS